MKSYPLIKASLVIFLILLTGCVDPSEQVIRVTKSWTEHPTQWLYGDSPPPPPRNESVVVSIKVSDVEWWKKFGGWVAHQGKYTYTPLGEQSFEAIENYKSGKSHFYLSDAEKGRVIGVVIAEVAIITFLILRSRKKKAKVKEEIVAKQSPVKKTPEKKRGIQENVSPAPREAVDFENPLFASASPVIQEPNIEVSGLSGIAAEIESFADLRDKGIITEDEFQKKKKELLDS